MNNSERVEQLLKFLQEEPNDPFLLYALAVEYTDREPEEAMRYFEKLLREHETYTATYYHAAALYSSLGTIEKAREIYLKGIEICEKQGKIHALTELRTAYTNFLYENE